MRIGARAHTRSPRGSRTAVALTSSPRPTPRSVPLCGGVCAWPVTVRVHASVRCVSCGTLSLTLDVPRGKTPASPSLVRPLALRLADVLELRPASFELPEQTRPIRHLRKEACAQLISHPKDGAVIYQDGNILPVRSNLTDTVWYLNGKRATMNKENIVIPHYGFHRVTAVKKTCRQTVILEVKKHDL